MKSAVISPCFYPCSVSNPRSSPRLGTSRRSFRGPMSAITVSRNRFIANDCARRHFGHVSRGLFGKKRFKPGIKLAGTSGQFLRRGSFVIRASHLPIMAGGNDIEALLDNPESFLKDNYLGYNIRKGVSGKKLVELVPSRNVPARKEVQLSERESESTISAYVLGYKDNKANDALFLDIPRTGVEEGTFFFTAELSGCSVVVTKLNDDTYRVFHDYRSNSAVLYDNVIMYVNWDDYKIPKVFVEDIWQVGHALACMQFRDGAWKMFVQRQYQGFSKQSKGTNWEVEVHLDVKEIANISLQSSFDNRRVILQQSVKALAKKLGINSALIDNAEDGTFAGSGEFDDNDPSIRGWNELRDAIEKELEIIQKQAKPKPYFEAMESVCRKHTHMLIASKDSDRIWLWLQIKKATGANGNGSTGGEVQASYTINERYAEMENELMSGSDKDKFMDAYNDYKSIDIPQMQSTMTSSEMKELFVITNELSVEQKGALCRHISVARNQDPLMEMHEQIQSDFKSYSTEFLESAPQHFFLKNVGDKYGGRCYPLVRAMAVALSTGEEVAKTFLDKLREFSEDELTPSQQKNAECLRDALAGLHANAEAHSASTTLSDVHGITDVMKNLQVSKQTKVYALNTQTHSMLVGVTVIDNQRKYYFYDPNFLIASFDNESKFQQAMENFFVEREFAKNYKAFGSAEDPKFKMVLIDSDKMGQARVDGGITVKNISSGIDLGDIFDSRIRKSVVGNAEFYLTGDLNLRAAHTAAEAYELTARWRDASIRLEQEGGLMGRWTPLLDTLHERTGGSYTMQYMDANNTQETRWVSTRDETFKEFTSYLKTKWMAIGNAYTFENGKFTAHATPEGDSIDGLNAMFAVQSIMDWLNHKHSTEATESGEAINSELSVALKVHSYVNMVQIGHTGILDIRKVADLVKTALEAEQLAGEVSLSTFVNVFKSTATEGFGAALGFINVGLDAYQLWFARNEVEKATFGTQLAFDLASSAAGVAGIGAGLAGASGLAMTLSGVGVLLGGLGIGIGALAQSFGQIASNAQQVGNYFATVDEAYSGGGYKYETNEKALVPLSGAVVTTVQMAEKEIEVGFDSQFIYRTHHGRTGSGRINYFFWIGDKPQMVHDRSEAINVRKGIGYNDDRHRMISGKCECLILPVTPKSFISYEYMILPFATSRRDRGFDVIRRLEQDERFDYDFYVFPSEYIINKIKFEYVETKIAVVMDKRSIRLQMFPKLPKELHGYLIYQVEGTGGEYCIGLAKGYSLSLKTSGLDAKKTTWIIDGSTLEDKSVEVGKDFVNVGGITINLLDQQFSRLLLISPGGEVSQVDLASQQAMIQSEDAAQWTDKKETIEHHLEKMAQEHKLSGQFVVVNNYIAEVKGQKRQVGRAYYDVLSNRMLYTDVEADIGSEIINVSVSSGEHVTELPSGRLYEDVDAQKDAVTTRDAFLGGLVGNDAYFFNTRSKSLWRVNAETHQITAKYYTSTQFDDSDIKLSAVSQHGDLVSMAISPMDQEEKGVEEIAYLIYEDRMVLSSVVGNSDLFTRINVIERISLTELVGGKAMSGTEIIFEKLAGQSLVLPSNAEIVTVLFEDEKGGILFGKFCCWLRTSDDTLIRASVQPHPKDLILTPTSHKVNGEDVYYFYSVREEAVYWQQGPGHANAPHAKQMKVRGLTNLFSVHGEVFATTKAGRVFRLLVDGSLYLEAVNEHWLVDHPKWWLDLASLDGKKATSISVLGVQDSKNQVVPIWYQDGKLIIASSKLHGKQLQFFGLHGDDQDAWLFDLEDSLLYRQPLTSGGNMDEMFNSEGKLINEGSHKISEAEVMLGGERLKEPAMVDGNLRVTTESGVVLVVGGHRGMATLVAVDKAWQNTHHEGDMENLAKTWSHGDVVALQDDSGDSVPGWYHFPSGETVRAQGLKWSDKPMWMGKTNDGRTSYVYAHYSLYAVDGTSVMREIGRFTAAKVQGNSLVLQSTNPNAEISIPTIAGLDFNVITAANAKVVINKENWEQYKVITINNKMDGSGERMVEIKYSDEHMLIQKIGNDMVLVDGSTGSSIILVNVLAEDAEHGHYLLKVGLGIDGEEFMISTFHERLGRAHPLLEDCIFSVTEFMDFLDEDNLV